MDGNKSRNDFKGMAGNANNKLFSPTTNAELMMMQSADEWH